MSKYVEVMSTTMTVSEARAALSEILDRVSAGALNDRPRLSQARADELIAEVSAGRNAR